MLPGEPILARCGFRCDLCLAYRSNVEANPASRTWRRCARIFHDRKYPQCPWQCLKDTLSAELIQIC